MMKKNVLIVLVTIIMFFIGMYFGYNEAIKHAEPFIENGVQFIDFNGNVHQYDFIDCSMELKEHNYQVK